MVGLMQMETRFRTRISARAMKLKFRRVLPQSTDSPPIPRRWAYHFYEVTSYRKNISRPCWWHCTGRGTGRNVRAMKFCPCISGSEIEENKFVTGFEVDDDVSGRPVDVAEGINGEIYISDDYTGMIYRVVYQPGVP